MARIIGIRHRVKKTTEGEARPTTIAMASDSGVVTLKLEEDQDEFDFLYNLFPTAYRAVEPHEDISNVKMHHRRTRRLKDEERPDAFCPAHIVTDGKKLSVTTHVPSHYDGLQANDIVLTILGGSGAQFVHALSNIGDIRGLNTQVFGIPPFSFNDLRGSRDKDDDHLTLIEIFRARPSAFYLIDKRERDVIAVAEALAWREDCQGDRIACQQRLYQRLRRQIFLSVEGGYPEGTIADRYDQLKANDTLLASLIKREEEANEAMAEAAMKLPIWKLVLNEVTGCGTRIAAGIIASIGDIRRFERPNEPRRKAVSRVKAYLGVHVRNGGKYKDVPQHQQFPRKRVGSIANWDEARGRQALVQFADQMNYRPSSPWGKRLAAYKKAIRARHPEVVQENGKRRYTDGHILRMARWRTLTRFVEWMAREWMRIDDNGRAQPKPRDEEVRESKVA